MSQTLNLMFAVIVVLFVVAYVSYVIGLYRVFKRLGRPAWKALVPGLNYYSQVRAVGAPRKWFLLSLVPYLGVVYAGSIAIRLGYIFGKKPSFSLFWLTFGAFAGMPIIAKSPTIDTALHQQPIKLLDVRALRKKIRHEKNQLIH